MRVLLEPVDVLPQLLDLLLNLLHGVQLVLDGDHVPFDLRHLRLARLHRFRELLQLGAYLAEGDRRLEVAVATLELIQLGAQVRAHHAHLLLQAESG